MEQPSRPARPPSEATRPALILLAGLPGTGKSHLAALAARWELHVLRSDEVRKALNPVPSYTHTENARVYRTSYKLIESLLADGQRVIFDATNLLRRGRRRAARAARAHNARFLTILTTSPPEVVAQRLRRRAAGQSAAYSSDADWAVHERLAGTMEGLSPGEAALVVDTSVSLEPAFEAVERLLT